MKQIKGAIPSESQIDRLPTTDIQVIGVEPSTENVGL